MTQDIFATRVKSLKASAIREIFKILEAKDVISFAAGAPSPDVFPGKELASIASELLADNYSGALQYSVTEGYTPLRDAVRARLASQGSVSERDNVIIVTGGQQGIDLAAKVLIEDGDGVVVENPSFIGGLNSFRSYNAKLFDVRLKDDGMDLDQLEEILKNNKIKLIYTIPTFQNPSGITASLENRKRLIALANQYDAYILEDNPYGELRFAGENVPTIKSLDTEGRVIYCGSFSKTLSPGLRVGFVSARADIIDRIVVVKQVNDVHTPILNQMCAYRYMTQCDYNGHIKKCSEIFGRKCAVMIEEIECCFPKSVTHTNPQGGLFILCTLPEGSDSKAILQKAIAKGVAFVPGNTFLIDMESPSSILRLNYSASTEEKIREGIRILGEVLHECLD